MTITLDLQPEIETTLLAQAHARGVTLHDYVEQIVVKEAQHSVAPAPGEKSLLQFFRDSPLVGVDLEFERDKDFGRDVLL